MRGLVRLGVGVVFSQGSSSTLSALKVSKAINLMRTYIGITAFHDDE